MAVPDGLEELVPLYLADRRRDFREVSPLATAADLARMRVIGHNLAGSGASYGFEALSHLGAALERAARQGDFAESASQVAAIRRYLDLVQLATAG